MSNNLPNASAISEMIQAITKRNAATVTAIEEILVSLTPQLANTPSTQNEDIAAGAVLVSTDEPLTFRQYTLHNIPLWFASPDLTFGVGRLNYRAVIIRRVAGDYSLIDITGLHLIDLTEYDYSERILTELNQLAESLR